MAMPRITLIPNWRAVLRRGWSIRLILLAGLLSGLEVVLPWLGEQVEPRLMAGLSCLVVAAAFVARLLAQRGLSDDHLDPNPHAEVSHVDQS